MQLLQGRASIRRAITVPAFLVAFVLVVALFPALVLVTLVFDLARRTNLAFTRSAAMLLAYLFCEAAGILACGWTWLTQKRPGTSYFDRNYRIQAWWAGSLFRAGAWLFRIKVVVDGDEAVDRGPFLLLIRHVSPLDNLLASVFVAEPRGIQLRWVLNQSLLRDPCVDIIGGRLKNAFVSTETERALSSLRKVRALAHDLGPRDGITIYPEGTLFTPEKRRELLERAAERRDELAIPAAALVNVLPPRLAGTLALLDAAPGTDVVFCAHAGLEKATRYRSMASGGAVGITLRIRFWRIDAGDIPVGRAARSAWLLDQWARVDREVTAMMAAGPG